MKLAIETNIRAGAGFTPKQIGGGTLKLWVRADQGITIATGVSQWNDLSGNGNHVTQGTGSAQPAFVASGQGGRPLVRFVSANSQVLLKVTTDLIGSGAYSFFCVAKVNDSGIEKSYFGNSNGVGGACMIKSNVNVRQIAEIGDRLFDDAVMTLLPEFITVTRPAGSGVPSMWVNRISQSLSGAAASLVAGGVTNRISVGARDSGGAATSFIDGDIYEGGIYTTVLSTADRQRLENYLHSRYGI